MRGVLYVISIVTIMANSLNDSAFIEEKLKELDHMYNTALHSGEKFSVLKDIRDKINELLQQLPLDGNTSNENGHTSRAGKK
jgi:hypothetical protein